jgi:AcrR family transcriptional regulator
MTSDRPRGRNEVIEALLRSARKLIADQGPAVALRDIADDAGVNFGLIYQYLGTKEQLVREVYGRATDNAASRLTSAESLEQALALLMTFGDGTTARLVGWAAMEGSQPAETFRDSPALGVLARLMLADAHDADVDLTDEDAQVFAALAMVIALGWRLFGNTALFAAGLDGSDPERYNEQIRMYLEHLARAATQHDSETSRPQSELPARQSRRRRGA